VSRSGVDDRSPAGCELSIRGLQLDEFGGDADGCAGQGEYDRPAHCDLAGITGLAIAGIVRGVSQPWIAVPALDPDAVLLDQVVCVDIGEQLQLAGHWLAVAVDAVYCPDQRRPGQFLGEDLDHSAHHRGPL